MVLQSGPRVPPSASLGFVASTVPVLFQMMGFLKGTEEWLQLAKHLIYVPWRLN